ncbi:hypothetical protein FB451DRAFT_1023540 [Mycena latifolia]|nr:hypothetical protein FB451DRAFT_1023540 [Mycena latifolia]
MSDSNGNDEAPTRTLKMAGGKIITFCEPDIPDPPAISFAKDIEDLLQVWDDNSPHWNGTSPLKINAVPVPLIYWPTVYKYWRATQWKGVKKILVRAMSRTTLDDFWAQCSSPDKNGQLQCMKYTRILTHLANEWKTENKRLANLARAELTPEQLTYRKGANHYVMTKDSMIAAYYCKLKGFDAGESDGDDDD